MNPRICLILFAITSILSCKKTPEIENAGLTGKWKLAAVLEGYLDGGGFQWTPVSNENSHTLTFSEEKNYVRKENRSGNFSEGKGAYTFQDMDMEIKSG